MRNIVQDPPENQRSTYLRARLATEVRRLGVIISRREDARIVELMALGPRENEAKRLLELYALLAEIGRRQAHLYVLYKGQLGPGACANVSPGLASVADAMRPVVELLALLGEPPPTTTAEAS
jgi:hypothetical protein